MNTQEFEQAKRELAKKWELTQPDLEIWRAEGKIIQVPIPEFLSDLTALLEQHKEVILREELIRFGKTLRAWGIELPSDILECAADEHIEYLKSVKK